MAKFMTCTRCNGKAIFECWMHIESGKCFLCGGSGKIEARKAYVAKSTKPELRKVPESEQSTEKQWMFILKLAKGSHETVCELVRQAGAPIASQPYVSKKTMHKAIQFAMAA